MCIFVQATIKTNHMITINDLKAITEKLQREAESKNKEKHPHEFERIFSLGEVYGMQTAIYRIWAFINEQQKRS